MKRTLFGTALLASLFVAGAYWSAMPVAAADPADFVQDADVGGQARLLRVAIPADGKLGEVLRKNARLSGGFEVIDRKSIPAALIKAQGFNPTAWSDVGADVVIMATKSGSQVKMRLFEVAGGNKPVINKGYPGGNELKAANRFMNDVIEYYDKAKGRGPFGSKIAVVRTRRNPTVSKNIQTVQMNGEAPGGVTANRSLNILPSIGPGGQVLFTSYAKRNPDLWMSGGGGGSTRVSKYPGLNLGGVLDPSGSTIAVALSKDGNSEIYTMGTNGSVKARLTKNGAIDGSPTWSPGGQIAFVSSRAGGPQVFRMSAGGGGGNRVTKKGSYNQSPDWCQAKHCADWIVYSGREGSSFNIYKVNVKSGQTKTLTSGGRNLDPSWSPDGRLVAFSKNGTLVVANESGNNQIEIARGASTPDWGPLPAGM